MQNEMARDIPGRESEWNLELDWSIQVWVTCGWIGGCDWFYIWASEVFDLFWTFVPGLLDGLPGICRCSLSEYLVGNVDSVGFIRRIDPHRFN